MNNQNAISRYMLRRTTQNANLYAQKNALEQAFEISRLNESLFEILQMLTMQSLQNGHTVVSLTNRTLPDDEILGTVLLSWQYDFLLPMLMMINEKLAEPLDFVQIFGQILQIIQQNPSDTQMIVRFIDGVMQNLQTRLQTDLPQLLFVQKQARLQLLLGVLRLYYAMNTGRLTWQNLPKLLADNVFFGELDDLLAKKYRTTKQGIGINPPLVYHQKNNEMYLWTNRAFCAESELMSHIWRIDGAKTQDFGLQNLPISLNQAQQNAVQLVAKRAFALITGGPGTGKTFTVAQIVLAMSQTVEHLRLALSAPTGKAAQRMSESLQKALQGNRQIALPEPKTIHRLLGIGATGRPRYHQNNPLPYDVIIIDEASMLGAELACQLLAAVKTGTRLILLGDANQLAAVDAGAVLADLCRMPVLQNNLVRLTESRRFDANSGVGKLAALVNQRTMHDWQAVADLLAQYDDLSMIQIGQGVGFYDYLIQAYKPYVELTCSNRWRFGKLSKEEQAKTVSQMMQTLNQYRILCASHQGRCGDEQINEYVSKYHREQLKLLPSKSPWYHGRVVMITKNRYDLGLFNGDIGICVQSSDGLQVYFEGESLRCVSVDVLDEQVAKTAYAITVHKSQGSEWQQVGIVFDEQNERLLSKELIYTAITRAKRQVVIFGTQTALMQAINTPTVRQTGLEFMMNVRQNHQHG